MRWVNTYVKSIYARTRKVWSWCIYSWLKFGWKESVSDLLQCAPKEWSRAWRTKKLTCIYMCTQRDTHLAVLFTRLSCQLDVFHPKMIEAWRKPPQMPHSQFELTSCPFFIVSASPHFPPFYFPVPLHCLLPCMQYYYSFGSGCRPNASKSDIISEQLRHLNNREWAGLTSPVTLHWLNYLEKVAKIYLGAVFISTCSWILIKGVCAEQKSSPEQQLFLALTSRLTTDFIRPAQLGVRLIVGNCRSIVNL